MVEVKKGIIQSGTNPFGEAWAILYGMMSSPVFWGFVVLVVIIAIIVVLYWTYLKKQDIQRRKDDPEYKKYREIKEACQQNAIPQWIKKMWSFKNVFVLFIPLFSNEASFQIKDINRNLIGYYRGHLKLPCGEMAYLFYKKKNFFFFEQLEILRCMHSHKYSRPVLDGDGNITYETKGREKSIKMEVVIENKYKELHKMFPETATRERDCRWLEIQCEGVVIECNYYFVPSYFYWNEKEKVSIDIQAEYAKNSAEMTVAKVFDNFRADVGTIVDETARSNPDNAKGRYAAEKTDADIRSEDANR